MRFLVSSGIELADGALLRTSESVVVERPRWAASCLRLTAPRAAPPDPDFDSCRVPFGMGLNGRSDRAVPAVLIQQVRISSSGISSFHCVHSLAQYHH